MDPFSQGNHPVFALAGLYGATHAHLEPHITARSELERIAGVGVVTLTDDRTPVPHIGRLCHPGRHCEVTCQMRRISGLAIDGRAVAIEFQGSAGHTGHKSEMSLNRILHARDGVTGLRAGALVKCPKCHWLRVNCCAMRSTGCQQYASHQGCQNRFSSKHDYASSCVSLYL